MTGYFSFALHMLLVQRQQRVTFLSLIENNLVTVTRPSARCCGREVRITAAIQIYNVNKSYDMLNDDNLILLCS